jgi:flagella basal body P-ring formation protein FlgA
VISQELSVNLLTMAMMMRTTAVLTSTCGRLARRLAALVLLVPSAFAASPQETLIAEVAKWVASQNQVPVDQVIIAPLDSRVAVQPCASQYSFDYPFVNRESVRARCLKPAWQLYVKAGFAQVQQPVPANAKPSNQAAQVTTPPPPHTPPAPVTPESRMVLVAASNLTVGQLLQPEMFKLEKMDADKINKSFLFEATGLEGQELVRPLRAGEPVRNVDMRQAIMVKRGELVQLTVGKAGEFQISVRLEAMQDGRLGEQIKLRNTESGRILGGVVTGKGVVKGS